jgi:hypothetical protein
MIWIDFPQLQPLLETVQVLQQKGLTGEGILQTIFSRAGVAGTQLPRLPLLLPAGCCKCRPQGLRNSDLWGCGVILSF